MINLADLRLYFRLLTYLKPHKWRMTAAIVAMLGVSALTALLAYMVKPVLDDVFFAKRENMLYLAVAPGGGPLPGQGVFVLHPQLPDELHRQRHRHPPPG